jgi:hypothetical protein
VSIAGSVQRSHSGINSTHHTGTGTLPTTAMENGSRGHGLPDGELESLKPLQRQRSGGGQGSAVALGFISGSEADFYHSLGLYIRHLGLVGGAGDAFAQATSTVVTSHENPGVVGQTVTLIAMVTVTGAFVPGGPVQFFDGATLLGPSFVGTGSAIFTISSLTIGAHSITAVYGGDANGNLASTSPALIQTVINQAASSTSPVSSLNPSAPGQSVTLTATVTGVFPSGTVQFKDGASNLGSAVTLAGGVASFTTSSLTSGSHNITAVYSGDGNNATSASAALTQTVNQAASSTSLVSSLNPSAPGQSVTFTATVSGASPTGTVQFKDGASNQWIYPEEHRRQYLQHVLRHGAVPAVRNASAANDTAGPGRRWCAGGGARALTGAGCMKQRRRSRAIQGCQWASKH